MLKFVAGTHSSTHAQHGTMTKTYMPLRYRKLFGPSKQTAYPQIERNFCQHVSVVFMPWCKDSGQHGICTSI